MPILFVGLAALSLVASVDVPRSIAELLQWTEYFIAAFLLLRSALVDRTLREKAAWQPRIIAVRPADSQEAEAGDQSEN